MKSVLITGCSDGGIGSALAIEFQSKGYLVFAAVRDFSKAKSLDSINNVKLLQLDVTKSDQIEAAKEAIAAETGGTLDYLINNAATSRFMPILDEDIDACKAMYDTNVWGPLAVTQSCSDLVIKVKGTIVFITSISGYVGSPYLGTYAASKRALEIMAETLRLEVAPFGVSVLSIVTGAVTSQMQSHFDNLELPQQSRYKLIEKTIAKRAKGGDGVARMSSKDYAAAVVRRITSGASGKAWYGGFAGMVKFGSKWLPQWMIDMGLVKDTGLDELRG